MTNTPSAMPNGASHGPRCSVIMPSTMTTMASMAANISRCAAPKTSPRFQARNGPNGSASSSGTISGPKVQSK